MRGGENGKFCLISLLFHFIFIHQFCMPDACAFFLCPVLGWCVCCGGGSRVGVWTHWFVEERFPLLFLLLLEYKYLYVYGKEK